jgi:hypothetical protein
MEGAMIRALVVFGVLVVTGCESTPPASAPSAAAKRLTKDECVDLGQWILNECGERNDRSSQSEGWCSDMRSRTGSDGDGRWYQDCEKYMTAIDDVCYRSSNSIRGMADCDTKVSRP